MAARAEPLTDDQKRLLKKLDEAVRRRAAHARGEQEETIAIAALCVELRAHQTPMATLAEHVKVVKDDELKSVTRQAVDQLVAGYEHRERRPRRRRSASSSNGAIKVAAFK